MQRLIEFILKFKDQIVLLLLVIVSFYFISVNDNQQMNKLRAGAFGAFASIEKNLSLFSKYINAIDEAAQLRKENMIMAEEIYRLRSARLENLQLRKMINLKSDITFNSIPADIISKSIFRSSNHFTLNVGSEQGVEINDPVVSTSGIVGRIVLVDDHYSIAQLMISDDFKMAAKLQKSNAEGIIKWDGSDIGHVILNNIVQTIPVMKGEPVVTSAFSTYAPEGIPIGIVDSVYNEPTNIFLKIRVKTEVDFSKLAFVYVTSAKTDSSLIKIESVKVNK